MGACPDELACDFAETYGVLDWRALPLLTAATLAQGLPASSRTARVLTGGSADEKTLLLAVIADRLGQLIWMLSEDGQHGKNRPPSLLDALTGAQRQSNEGYDTAAEFLSAWKAITGGEANAGH